MTVRETYEESRKRAAKIWKDYGATRPEGATRRVWTTNSFANNYRLLAEANTTPGREREVSRTYWSRLTGEQKAVITAALIKVAGNVARGDPAPATLKSRARRITKRERVAAGKPPFEPIATDEDVAMRAKDVPPEGTELTPSPVIVPPTKTATPYDTARRTRAPAAGWASCQDLFQCLF